MASLALLVGNSIYAGQGSLPCCAADVDAVEGLLVATGRYETVRVLKDAAAESLKSLLRECIEPDSHLDELLFYFSGHGYQSEDEFYFCGTDFDGRRPNETGLSNNDFHDLIRPSSPTLMVKIIDACHSGIPLIKRDRAALSVDKGGLNRIIQISSCLSDQVSLVGNPLSEFTRNFCQAATSKASGTVYYTDVISSLRDAYIGNESQTPHFVTQHTGREVFAADGSKLDPFRKCLAEKWTPSPTGVDEGDVDGDADEEEVHEVSELSLADKLRAAESKYATPFELQVIPGKLFDGLKERLAEEDFSELFDLEIEEHGSFQEEITRGFIIRNLHREARPDNFVTADIIRTKKRRTPWDSRMSLVSSLYGDDDFDETWELKLNCRLERAQLRVSFIPKFTSLQKMTLVVTCAPSLSVCYVFEHLSLHKRLDFGHFDSDGHELVKNWYKQGWKHDTGWLVERVADKLVDVIEKHLDAASAAA